MTRSASHLARVLLALALSCLAPAAHAQAAPTTGAASQADLLREINRDIWGPFASAYQALDVEAFLPIHRADFVRAQGDSKRVQNLAEYSRDTCAFYGKFHVISRKEGGTWRFLVDYDSNEGGTITLEDFGAGVAVEDLSKS